MKRAVQILTMSVFLLVGICPGTVYAKSREERDYNAERSKRKKERVKKYRDNIAQEIGLSDKQRQRIKDHRNTQRDQAKKYRQSLRELKGQIREELQKEDFSEPKVRALQNHFKNVQSEMVDHRLDGVLEIRKTLTSDQFHKISEMREKHKENQNKEK